MHKLSVSLECERNQYPKHLLLATFNMLIQKWNVFICQFNGKSSTSMHFRYSRELYVDFGPTDLLNLKTRFNRKRKLLLHLYAVNWTFPSPLPWHIVRWHRKAFMKFSKWMKKKYTCEIPLNWFAVKLPSSLDDVILTTTRRKIE